MKSNLHPLAIILAFMCGLWSAAAQSTAFTYQGRLNENGSPANGTYDLRFTIYDATGGSGVVAGPLTNSAVAVANGLFTAALDFGIAAFNGADRWLEIAVRTNGGGGFTALTPRQFLAATPYALVAGDVTGANIARLDVPNTAAQATGVPVVTSGFITGATVTSGGAGYATPPTVTVSGATGFGAVITANVSNGAVVSLNVVQAGSGYSAGTTLSIDPPPSNAYQVFASTNYFTGVNLLTNGNNVFVGTFAGDGALLVNLNASALASGTVPDARLPASVARLDGAQTFNGPVNFNNFSNVFVGTFNGDGAAVTNVNLATISSAGAITASSSPIFFPSASLSVGDYPRSVTSADVNGDGHRDLICANNFADTLSVLINNGDGRFTLASSLSVGDGPQAVVAADVNGDGRSDLVSANANAGTLSVLTNNGSGGFTLAASPIVGSNPYSVTVADVNGDGRRDLISGNFGAATLSVLTNSGSGAFTLAATLPVGNSPHSVTAADVNGDGYSDLISVATFVDALSVLTNNGSGSFTPASSLPLGGGSYPLWVTATDVNGDGHNDLISANFGTSSLSVLTNNGGGGFVLASSPAVGGDGPHSIAVANLDGDDRIDLVCVNQGSATLSVLTNGGGGRFTLVSTLAVGSGPSSVTAADLNNDGRSDFITANQNDDTLSVLLQNPFHFNGSFSGNFNGRFNGDGSGLTGLNASNITSGTLADARLSANVARRAGGNAFTSNQTITGGSVGIGTGTPAAPLHVLGPGQIVTLVDSSNTTGTWLAIGNSSTGGQRWSIISTGSGNGEGAGRLLFFTSQSNDAKMRLEPTGSLFIDGTLTQNSDRNRKNILAPVDTREALEKVAALPLARWAYRDDPEAPHLGPMAQDFHAAFGLGAIETGIATVDADGVALAAIQGLNQKLEEKDARLSALEQELSELKRAVKKLSERKD